jgi:hypothetical protein
VLKSPKLHRQVLGEPHPVERAVQGAKIESCCLELRSHLLGSGALLSA